MTLPLIGLCTVCMLTAATGLSTVYLSSFTNLVKPAFLELFKAYVNYGDKVKTLGYIGTAQFAYNPDSLKNRGEQRRRARYDAKQKMGEISQVLGLDGGDPINIELDREDFSKDKLKEAIMSCSVIYVDGGNTFYLQKAMRDTCFWEVALPILKSRDRQYTYMGASAGGICAGASVTTALFKGWDDPRAGGAISEDYVWDAESYKGANVIGGDSLYTIFPHFKEEEGHAELINSKLRLLGGPGEKVLAVGDHEAIVKRGNEELICFDSLNTGTVPLRIFSQS